MLTFSLKELYRLRDACRFYADSRGIYCCRLLNKLSRLIEKIQAVEKQAINVKLPPAIMKTFKITSFFSKHSVIVTNKQTASDAVQEAASAIRGEVKVVAQEPHHTGTLFQIEGGHLLFVEEITPITQELSKEFQKNSYTVVLTSPIKFQITLPKVTGSSPLAALIDVLATMNILTRVEKQVEISGNIHNFNMKNGWSAQVIPTEG